MKLKSFRVREFMSVIDSGPVTVEDIACLVGKNEAGKSALLKALYRLNPLVEAEGNFDVTLDYPRGDVEDYRHAVDAKKHSVAIPIQATFILEERELQEIAATFGPNCIKTPELSRSKDYNNTRYYNLSVEDVKSIDFLISNADLSAQTLESLASVAREPDALVAALKQQEQTDAVKELTDILGKIKKRGVSGYIFDTFLVPREPKFLYFDSYYQMTGHENIEALIKREAEKTLKPSDHPLLGLIRLARLSLPDIVNPQSTIDLKSKLQGASNHLTKQVLKYWSQNKHLRMEFDVRAARPGDPDGMKQGTNVWGGVYDTRHQVTTELGSRSAGFVWFFSFLAWYSDVKRNGETLILLLDEPGLTLHAKAQEDLLRYFETELKGNNQLIYTTHSPFMVDVHHFERVRIVQDKSIDAEEGAIIPDAGTKVLTDVFAANSDSLFPLQGALGYEIHQTLFVGPYTLVVEGAADLLYLQSMSALLQKEGRTGLDARWTITPVGGAAKVPTFVALLGSQKGMTIATLIDTQIADQQKIESLYREKLLKKANVLTFADFTKTSEADIEDMFEPDFYVALVNKEYEAALPAPVDIASLPSKPRIIARLESHFTANPMQGGSQFGHFRPARYFSENVMTLSQRISKETAERFESAFQAVNALIK